VSIVGVEAPAAAGRFALRRQKYTKALSLAAVEVVHYWATTRTEPFFEVAQVCQEMGIFQHFDLRLETTRPLGNLLENSVLTRAMQLDYLRTVVGYCSLDLAA
jgi:hypothetical protein